MPVRLVSRFLETLRDAPRAPSPARPRAIVVRKRGYRTERRPLPMPDPMQTIRVGDVLAKSGRLPEARSVYRRAAEAFEEDGRLVHARAAWRLILSLDPRDDHARERVAELGLLAGAERSRSTPPPEPDEFDEPTVVDRRQRYRTEIHKIPQEHPIARITLARIEVETGRGRAVQVRDPIVDEITERRASLGIVPLEDGEELVPADGFCHATGHATVSIPIAVLRRRALESDENGDEEMYIDIPPDE